MRHTRLLSDRIFTGLVAAVTVLSPAVAHAEGAAAPSTVSSSKPEDAQMPPSRKLFLEGKKLASEGNYAEACPKLEESLRLEVGLGTQFNLADCWEHIGRVASAHALFLGAAASAKAAGQTDREQVLRERAAALEPRLSRLVIEVKSNNPKLSVKRDDLPLEADTYGKAVPLDPGKYTIKARAPGKKDWKKVVEVNGSAKVTTVEIPELEDEAPEVPASDERAAGNHPPIAAQAKVAPSNPESDRRSSFNYRALTVAGVGAVGMGVGAVMGLKYLSANGDAKDICPTGQGCSIKEIQDHDRLVSKARTDRAWSYAGFGAGGALLLGAGALWYFQRAPSTTGVSLRAAPLVARDGSVGAVVDGRF